MSVAVEIDTKIRIKDPDEGGDTDIRIDAGGSLHIEQQNDNLQLSSNASVALARIILQHHQVSFEPTFQQDVSYL